MPPEISATPAPAAPSVTPSAPSTNTGPTPASYPTQSVAKPSPARMTSAQFAQFAREHNPGRDESPASAAVEALDGGGEAEPEVPFPAEDNSDSLEAYNYEEETEQPWHEKYKDIHGIDVQELLEALANGTLPDALYNKLKIRLRNGDQEWEDTIEGARNGAMMRQAFQQKTQQVAKMRKQLDGAYQEFGELVDGWKDAKRFVQFARQAKLPLEDIAMQVAEELATRDALNKHYEGAGTRWYEAIQKEAEFETMQQQQAKLKKQAESRDAELKEKAIVNAIRKEATKAADELGMKWDNARWHAFKSMVANHYEEYGRPPRSVDVHNYVREANSLIEEAVGKRDIEAPPKKAAPAAKLSNGAPARPSPGAAKKGNARLTSAQMIDRLRGLH